MDRRHRNVLYEFLALCGMETATNQTRICACRCVCTYVNDLGSLWDTETLARGNEGSAVTDADQQLFKKRKAGGREGGGIKVSLKRGVARGGAGVMNG